MIDFNAGWGLAHKDTRTDASTVELVSFANLRTASLVDLPDITIQSSIPEIPDPLLNNVLAQRGKWDFAPVIREIRASKYDFVIVSADADLTAGKSFYRGLGLWPEDLWQAVKAHYVPFCLFHDPEVWLPRNVPNTADALFGIGCKIASESKL